MSDNDPPAREIEAARPIEPDVGSQPTSAAELSAAPAAPAADRTGTAKAAPKDTKGAREPEPTPGRARSAEDVRKEIAEARRSAEADGVALMRPLSTGAAAPADVRTQKIKNGTIRIATAGRDLSGGPEMLRAGDEGRPVEGGTRCTSKIRFSADVPAEERAGVLLCWRTSETRSVVALAATPNRKPDTSTVAAIIRDEWSKLG
ncbi:hypothetical protein AB0G04_19605 [Actinoplanes sp. NPDC023801]|uniref:hypothetical protein n=1 Tax=Actinoplanes sp. NPDC023801 TaxID=3154595 RepID=UPI0033DABCA2